MIKIIGKVRESKLEEEKAKGFNMQVGSWVIPKQWNILYSSLINWEGMF